MAGEGPVFRFEGPAPRVWVDDSVIAPAQATRGHLVAADDPDGLDWRGRGISTAGSGSIFSRPASDPSATPSASSPDWAETASLVRETGSTATSGTGLERDRPRAGPGAGGPQSHPGVPAGRGPAGQSRRGGPVTARTVRRARSRRQLGNRTSPTAAASASPAPPRPPIRPRRNARPRRPHAGGRPWRVDAAADADARPRRVGPMPRVRMPDMPEMPVMPPRGVSGVPRGPAPAPMSPPRPDEDEPAGLESRTRTSGLARTWPPGNPAPTRPWRSRRPGRAPDCRTARRRPEPARSRGGDAADRGRRRLGADRAPGPDRGRWTLRAEPGSTRPVPVPPLAGRSQGRRRPGRSGSISARAPCTAKGST